MAKLEYDEELVNSALEQLEDGKNKLSPTSSDLNSALSIIASARGIEYLDTGYIAGAPSVVEQCQDLIDQTILGINDRVEMVKAYNEEVEDAGVLDRIFSTVGLGATKFVEGIGTAGEQIVDGFASALGWVVGIFDKDAKKSIGKFVEKDHVGDFFGNLYDNELSGIVKKSYMKENGLAANILKGLGTATGYTLALAAGGATVGGISGGAANAVTGARAAMGSLKAGVAVAGVGGMGSGTQVGLQSGLSYNDALKKGIKTGALQAGTVVAVNYAIRGISKAASAFKANRAGKLAQTAGNSTDDILGGTARAAGTADDVTGAAGAADDVARAAGRTTGRTADDILNTTGKSVDDLADELADAVRRGEISPEDAMKAVNNKAASAASRADKVKYHPDNFEAKINAAAEEFRGAASKAGDTFTRAAGKTGEAADEAAGAASKAGQAADETASGATKGTGSAKSENASGTSRTSGKTENAGDTFKNTANEGTGGAGKTSGTSSKTADVAKVTADDSVDDIARACNEGKITRKEFDDLINEKYKGIDAKYNELAKKNPDGKLTPEQKSARNAEFKECHPDSAARKLDSVKQQGAENAMRDQARMNARKQGSNGTTPETGSTGGAASGTARAAGTADDVTRAAGNTGSAASGETVNGVPKTEPQLPAVREGNTTNSGSTGIAKTTPGSTELVPVEPKPDLPAVVDTPSELTAVVKSEPVVPKPDLPAVVDNTPQLPEVVPPTTPQPPSVVPPITPQPPSVVPPTTPQPPSVVPPITPQPPSVVPPITPQPPSVVPPITPQPPSVVPPTPTQPPVVIPPPVTPTPEPVPDSTPIIPVPIPPTPDPVLDPTPVIPTPITPTPNPVPDPTPVIPTPVTPTPDSIVTPRIDIPAETSITPTPTPTVETPIAPTPTPTQPVVTPITPTPTPTQPVVTPITPTPTPTQPVVTPTTPVTTPQTDYVPIPNTGVAGKSTTFTDYAVPAAIGAATGIIGTLAAKKVSDNEDEKKEKQENQV